MTRERHPEQDPIYPKTYSISTVVLLTGVSGRQLARYERARLVLPMRHGSQRYYRDADVQRIRRVRRLQRDLGINLAGIEVVLRLTEELAEARRQLADRAASEESRH